jgi:prepilin-type N-terminal cleavage/methylation domain-containing protein
MTGRGFTLVEIVVALALTLIVTGSIHRLLVTTQRLSRTQAAQMDLQSGVRAGSLVIANELRELSSVQAGSADQTDILSITNTSMTYRAARGMGFLCESPRASQVRIARSTYSGFRDPEPARDAAYLFVEGNPATGVPDTWLPLAITGVTSASTCPGAAGPAISIDVASGSATSAAPMGTPLRVYEVMELRIYQSSGEWWLGLRSVSAGEAIQPVIGPLAGSAGLRLQYLNRAGAPTIDPASVSSVIVTLRGSSHQPVAGTTEVPLEEELVTQVTLRNTIQRRPSE